MFNLIKNYKKLGKKKFMEKFKEGIMKIPQEHLLKTELYGYLWSIFGILLACVLIIIFMRAVWPLIFAMIFSVIIYIAQALQTYQKLQVFKQCTSEIVNLDEVLGQDVALP